MGPARGGLYEPAGLDGFTGRDFIDRGMALAHTGAGAGTGVRGRGTGDCLFFFPGARRGRRPHYPSSSVYRTCTFAIATALVYYKHFVGAFVMVGHSVQIWMASWCTHHM